MTEVMKQGTINNTRYWVVQDNLQEHLVFEDDKLHKIVIDHTPENMKLITDNTFSVNKSGIPTID